MAKILFRLPKYRLANGTANHDYPQTYPVVECDACENTVHCIDGWANSCSKCGTEFNGSGQTLAPRAQWGEETGECFT